jgi:hypothetical protein
VLVTRIGYVLIIGVIATAAAAITLVLRPGTASHPAAIQYQQVIDYTRYGVVERIETKGQTLTVHFSKDFDTQAQLGTSDHVFDAMMPPGEDVVATLAKAGITVNGPTGLQVVAR